VALITGDGGGICLGIARAFIRAGMKVPLADVDPRRASTGTAAIRDAGGVAAELALDVTEPPRRRR
jgi:NAD(P)-dependent dehydrogenase (short-subunit alcohol dehydrogenase family)